MVFSATLFAEKKDAVAAPTPAAAPVAALAPATARVEKLEQKNKERELRNTLGFTSHVILEQKEPKQIIVRKPPSTEAVITFNTDAIDGMGFCDTSRLNNLSADEKEKAIKCLIETLKEHFGGKNCFTVAGDLIPIFKTHGIDVVPQLPSGKLYERLMAAHVVELSKKLEKEVPIPSNIIFTSDKESLLTKTAELSELFVKNADYASRSDKRSAYSPAAMAKRIDNNQVHVFAAEDKKGNPIAFLRVYVDENNKLAYTSDLVVAEAYRKKGVASFLMKHAFTNLQKQNKVEVVSLIAGDDKEAEFYRDHLGFSALTTKSFIFSGNRRFIFGLFPMQELLIDYQKSFTPEPEKTIQLRR